MASCAVAVLGTTGASAASKDFFGVMPQAALTDADYERMGQARVGSLRFEISWANSDPTAAPGDFDFASTDTTMAQLAEEGIRPIPFLFGTPEWAARRDGQSCKAEKCLIYAPREAASLAAWSDFVTAVGERYGPGGSYWSENPSLPENPIEVVQVWNEQNSPSFYGKKPDVADYAKLVDASNKGAAAADGSIDVLLGGMFGTPLGGRKPGIAAWDFLERLYKIKGAKKDFDGVGVHPYASRLKNVAAQVDLMREAIVGARDKNVEMWITEIGWASEGPSNPLVRGAQGQADRLEEAFDYFLEKRRKLNVQAVIWYSWRDNLNPDAGLCVWCPGSGLVTEDLVAKPALGAFTAFTKGS